MDYYLSSAALLTPGSDAHYSETLIRLPSLPTYFYRPPSPARRRSRAHFGLPEDKHLYLCTQNLRKIHPDFDPILAGILSRDLQAALIFVADKQPAINHLLRQRWQVTLPEGAGRIWLLPYQAPHDYLSLIALADVSLDTLHFGGANTAYDALAAGVPIVTLPTPFERGRYTYALYHRMELLDCIAGSPAAYIDLALKLGTDPAYRAEISARIRAACPVLFEDMAPVRELEAFFEEVLEQARHR
jgi:predicted O-linked N-acetylglucosamine transferase (SPINDLY family)